MAFLGPIELRRVAGLVVRVAMVAAAGMALAACRTTGDFGRERPSYFRDHVVPKMRAGLRAWRGVDASKFPLTGSEDELRARSVAIIENEGPSAERFFDEMGDRFGVTDSTYQHERSIEHAAGTPDLTNDRYPRPPHVLLSAVTEDLNLLEGFASVAEIVYRIDKRRLRSLREGGDVPADDVLDTTGRAHENRAIVENTILALHNRVDDYEVELRRSVLAFPDGNGDAVDNAIGRLANRLRRFEHHIRGLADPDGLKHYPELMG